VFDVAYVINDICYIKHKLSTKLQRTRQVEKWFYFKTVMALAVRNFF